MKRCISLILLVAMLFCFVGCEEGSTSVEIVESGDVAYFAAMDSDRRNELKGEYIELTGEVYAVYKTLKSVRIGRLLLDDFYFDCEFADESVYETIEEDSVITIRGKVKYAYSSNMTLTECVIVEKDQPETTEPTEKQTESTKATTEPTKATTATEATQKPTETTPVVPATIATESSTTKPTEAPTQSEVMVWIPTNGGTKYHSKSTCSQMQDPEHVTITEAQNRGFDPCGRCY